RASRATKRRFEPASPLLFNPRHFLVQRLLFGIETLTKIAKALDVSLDDLIK
ncbi:MAG: hypothetical protein HYT48_02580, partial [Candidatus Vogelbacteria bacterium]|nr:hypothetical protein [Candidatus Vogelbacteria bacterium]